MNYPVANQDPWFVRDIIKVKIEDHLPMKTFALIPGSGGMASYWYRVVPLLKQADCEAIAVDLPGDDPNSGLSAYADLVITAIAKHTDVILVAQSLGAFTAALVCARVPMKIRSLIFVNAMIPQPGETPGEWWRETAWSKARIAAARQGGYNPEFDLATYFLHDLPKDIADMVAAKSREESDIAFSERADFRKWPNVPIHAVVGKDDRFFPKGFQARVARERLGIGVDVIAGGHLIALSHPRELADLLLVVGSSHHLGNFA